MRARLDPADGCRTCTAGTFQSCQDDNTALTCDASGSDVTATTCPNGCDTALGCRACAPNQTTCADGITETCDAAGNISAHETCTVGCSADASRCAALEPSNNLGMFFDMTPDPQDLTLSGTLDLKDGKLTTGGVTTTIPSFTLAAAVGGAPIRVVVGKHVTLGNLTVTDSSATNGLGRGLAVLATGDLDVTGRVSVNAGGVNIVGCTGGAGSGNGAQTIENGGGAGGGHASAGADGGTVSGNPADTIGAGGVAGTASGTDTLVPLRGGCPGGGANIVVLGGVAGGAIQLVSKSAVNVSGTLVVDASPAVPAFPGGPEFGGGGAGGGILVEAPTVMLGSSAKLLARGGGGAGGDGHALPVPLDDGGAPGGGTCNPVSDHCANGGNGAAPGFPAASGGNPIAMGFTGNMTRINAGGGGGGIGRIRINTADGNFATSASVITAASLTAGMVGTK